LTPDDKWKRHKKQWKVIGLFWASLAATFLFWAVDWSQLFWIMLGGAY
jgi:hypothetical protein